MSEGINVTTCMALSWGIYAPTCMTIYWGAGNKRESNIRKSPIKSFSLVAKLSSFSCNIPSSHFLFLERAISGKHVRIPSGLRADPPFSNIDTNTLHGHLINGYCSCFYWETAPFNALSLFLLKRRQTIKVLSGIKIACGNNKTIRHVHKHQNQVHSLI